MLKDIYQSNCKINPMSDPCAREDALSVYWENLTLDDLYLQNLVSASSIPRGYPDVLWDGSVCEEIHKHHLLFDRVEYLSQYSPHNEIYQNCFWGECSFGFVEESVHAGPNGGNGIQFPGEENEIRRFYWAA